MTAIAFPGMALPAGVQDFSQESEVKPWNLYAKYPARFEANAVDILYELTGDGTVANFRRFECA